MRNREERLRERPGRRIFGGLILIAVGTGFLLHNIYPWFSLNYILPAVLIVAGLYLLIGGKV